MEEMIGAVVVAVLVTLFLGLLLALPVWLLWNWLMPIIFGLPVITFWQALGLSVLARIFFGNSSTSS